jgi:hypothetical protein
MNWFRALLPKEDRFFGMFEQHAELLVGGAAALRQMLNGGDDVPKWSAEISRLEDEADEVTRQALLAVRRSFITPFDRSDIQGLVSALDDAIDQMKKTAGTAMLFDVRAFAPQMQSMGDLILQTSKVNAQAVPCLRNLGKEGARMTTLTDQMIALEDQADDIHDEGLRAAFAGGKGDPMAFYVITDLYDHLEKVMDRFEDVADQMNAILVEHL